MAGNGKYGSQQDRRRRRDTRAALQGAALVGLYVRPENGCDESKISYDMDDPDFRIHQRLVMHSDNLVEFAVILTRLEGTDWREVYSVDSMHGVLHEHVSGHRRPDDRQDIKTLHSQVDVQESLDIADEMVRNMYQRIRG